MKEEPFFLINEFLEKERKELELVIDSFNVKNLRRNEKAVFLRNFTNEIFRSYRKTKKTRIVVEKHEELEMKRKERELLLKKKKDLLMKLKKFEEEKKIVIEALPNIKSKEIILSKETGMTLVKTEFDSNSYKVIEPKLTNNDIILLKEFEENVKNMNLDDKEKFLKQLRIICDKYNTKYSDEYFDKIRYYVVRDLKKFGKISALVEDKDVKEIICSGFGKPITINYKDKQDVSTNLEFKSEDELNNFILYLANKVNQKISVENPFLTASLDGFNLQATFGSEFVKPKFLISKI
ncbi:hypothetical protein HYU23_04365 [Candidatus Woesearchaeota archaeon]|nr:hypothetical protein [Candidatus Woesearchaeota archaeon]